MYRRISITVVLFTLSLLGACAAETATQDDVAGDSLQTEEAALRAQAGGGAGAGAPHGKAPRLDDVQHRAHAHRRGRGHGHAWGHTKHEPAAATCDDVQCDEGTHCELQSIVCVTTPCDPIPECVPDVFEDLCPATSCPVGTTCEMQGNEAVCVTPVPAVCAAATCPVGTNCVDNGGVADCVPAMGGVDGEN